MKNYGSRFLLIFVVIALAAWQWADRGLRYGLDLEGGAALSYRVEREAGKPADQAIDINTILAIIEKRVNAFGLAEISLTATDESEILIEVPGRSKEQLDDIKSIIERNGNLEFRILAPETEQRAEAEKKKLFGDLYRTPANRRWVPHADGVRELLVEVPEQTLKDEVDALRAKLDAGENVGDELLAKEQALTELERQEVFQGKDLVKTAVRRQQVEIVVFFEMRRERKEDFREFTTRNLKRQMAIILDGKINSAPVIQSPLPGEGVISGGGGGGFKEKEARDLSIVLESGATGANLILEREDLLGPSLGHDAIETGKLSVIIGFASVLLIMLWLYRVPGLIANLALLLNVVILLGALAFFSAALTLAGIAGIVLTLGMAVDANILIFERLREERARGKSLIEALAAGYDRAIVAIVDANVTTVLTAIVLIVMGSGTVKGFGYTLTIGILASMFTAIYVTRTIFEWGVGSGLMKRFGFGAERKVPTVDFMRYRKWFTGPSLVLMALGFAVFLARDEAESKDLEFVGGQQVVIQMQKAVDRPQLMEIIGSDKYPGISAVRLDARGVTVENEEQSNRWQVRVPLDDRLAGEAFVEHVRTALQGQLLSDGFSDLRALPTEGGKTQVSFVLHGIELPPGVTADTIRAGMDAYVETGKAHPFSNLSVTPGTEPETFRVQADIPRSLEIGNEQRNENAAVSAQKAVEIFARDNARLALQKMDPPVYLSDPMPSVSFLNPGRAEQLWRSALRAVLLAMMLQIVYIRLRFADFKHGFAAVCALIHDVTIALGFVAVFDGMDLVHAKINLVLIAAFLTLIGYSMNDTIVVFDRIRENLGRSKVVRSQIVNDAINQTLTRSIRTSITTWIVVVIQFALNRGSASVLEGFAWVMVVGVISGTYSSIFIAGPLLLFLPGYWRKLSGNRKRLMVQLVATVVGGIVAITARGHGPTMLAGLVFAVNIPIHFMLHFIPWIGAEDPDSLLEEEIEDEEKKRPLHKPGI